ncbi:MFS transporter, partial [Streptomyces bacillaris]
ALIAPRISPDRHARALIVATCWACVLTAAALAWLSSALLAGLLCAICMCLSTVASIGFLSTLLIVTPEDRIGRVQSAAGFLSSMVQPFGPLAGGALLTLLGSRIAFGAIGCVLAVSAAVVTLAPSVRAGAATAPPTGEPEPKPEPKSAQEPEPEPAGTSRPAPDSAGPGAH